MSNAPADRARRRVMRSAALSCAESGEGFYFIGFDWGPHFHVRDMIAADVILSALYPQCFRAIIRVSGSIQIGYETAIVEVGGDDRVYGFKVTYGAKIMGRWAEAPEAMALEVLYLRRV